MNFNRVLIIGAPFLYDLVDEEILYSNRIIPIYSYKKGSIVKQTEYGLSVFYNALSEDCFMKIIYEMKPDAIVCYNDNFLIQTARLREKFNILGIDSKNIIKYKLKSEMYKVLEGNIAVPKTLKLDASTSTSLDTVTNQLGEGPYFIKPNDLAGSEGAAYIRTFADLEAWLGSETNKNYDYIIQKFYDLPLVHCELYVQNGVVLYIQARRYSYPNHQFLEGKIIASLPILDNNLSRLIESSSRDIVDVMEYKNGVMHIEFFVDQQQGSLIFLETNIRQAGGAINLIHKKRSGVSTETAMILLEFGKSLNINNNYYGHDICGYVPMRLGKVAEINIPRCLKGKYDFDVRVSVGDICDMPKSASNTSVAFLGHSDSIQDLEEDFDYLENNSIVKYQNFQ